MKDVILYISLVLNILVFAAMGWFGYMAYGNFKSAMASAHVTTPATVTDVLDINDGGYKARFYILDKGAGDRVVVNDYAVSKALLKVGDSVKIRITKNSFSGNNMVSYSIAP